MFGSGHFSADGRISYRTACALLGRDEGRHLPGGQVSLVIRFETITFSSKDKTSSLSRAAPKGRISERVRYISKTVGTQIRGCCA